jgi:hypothetical protein
MKNAGEAHLAVAGAERILRNPWHLRETGSFGRIPKCTTFFTPVIRLPIQEEGCSQTTLFIAKQTRLNHHRLKLRETPE